MTRSAIAVALCATLVLGAAACASRRPSVDHNDARTFGVYRCAIDAPGDSPPQFRMLLFAQLPDRLHAEVLGPMGGPRLILDTGAGAMSVTDVGEKVAFTGHADAAALSRLIGVSIGVDRLVAILLTGSDPEGGLAFTRHPERREGLPDSLELRAAGRSIRILLQSRRSVKANAQIGTGAPPGDMRVRPLAELTDARVPWPSEERESP